MSVYGENHYNIVISLQLVKIKGKKKDYSEKHSVRKSSLLFFKKPAYYCMFLCHERGPTRWAAVISTEAT